MELIGMEVEHIRYGKGIIKETRTDADGNKKVLILFGSAEKLFQYPDAFAQGYLSVTSELEEKIKADIVEAEEKKRLVEMEKAREQEAQREQERLAREAQNARRQRNRAGGQMMNDEREITVNRMRPLLEGHIEDVLEIWLNRIEEAIGGRLCVSYESPESFTIQREPMEPFDRICSVYGYVPIRVCRADGSIVQREERIDLSNPQNYYVVLRRR